MIPRHDDEIVPLAREAVGVDGTDSGRRTGDDRGAFALLCHCISPFA